MGSSAAIASSGTSIAGGVNSYFGSTMQGKYQSQVASTNADMARIEAAQALTQGGWERNQYGQKVNMMAGSQRASLAGQGVDPNTGSAAQISSQTQTLGALDKLTIMNNATKKAFGLNWQASNYDAQSAFTRIAGNEQGINSLLTGGMRGVSYGMQAFGGNSSNNNTGWENDDTLNSANADRHYTDGGMTVFP